MIAMEIGHRPLQEHDAHAKATEAREAYKDALRDVNLWHIAGFIIIGQS